MTDEGIILVLTAMMLGLIPALIAKRKGYPFVDWWIRGALIFIVALPWALFMKRRLPLSMMVCPACGNSVSKQAASCPKCGHPLSVGPAA